MKIALNSIIVTVLNVSGQLGKFLLFIIIAALFGANRRTDAFFLAMTIPTLFINPVTQSIQSVFIPLIAEWKANQPQKLGGLIGSALAYSLLISSGLAILLVVITHYTLGFFASGMAADAQKLAILDTGILAPMFIFQVLYAVLAAVYNTNQIFWIPAISDFGRYLTTIIFLLILKPILQITSLPVSFLIGGIFPLILTIIFWKKNQTIIEFTFKLDLEVTKSLRLTLPMILGYVALQLSAAISRFLASQLPEGSITILDYASRVSVGFMEVITGGVMLVALSDWSNLASSGQRDMLQKKLQQLTQVMLLIIMPIVMIAIILREPLIQILLERGKFQPQLVGITAGVMALFLIGLPIDMVGRLYARLYLIWQRTAALGLLSLMRLVFTTLFSLLLIHTIGVGGLALADTVSTIIISSLLIIYSRSMLVKSRFVSGKYACKMITAVGLCGLAAFFVDRFSSSLPVIAELGAAVLAGGVIYIIATLVLKIEEVIKAENFIKEFVHRKVFWSNERI
jgi:putative peptidoglycan lipid II flippase